LQSNNLDIVVSGLSGSTNVFHDDVAFLLQIVELE
jgi:hypothetical protein